MYNNYDIFEKRLTITGSITATWRTLVIIITTTVQEAESYNNNNNSLI